VPLDSIYDSAGTEQAVEGNTNDSGGGIKTSVNVDGA
jgi:hypothetical protein